MEQKICQICGMPLGETDEMCGTEADGSKNTEYCKYCYEKGEVTFKGTMQEMIDMCVPIMVKEDGMTEEAARKMMNEVIPTLNYWKSKLA